MWYIPKSKILLVLLLFPAILFSQRTNKTNKYSFGMEMNFGHSFPGFEGNQDRWKGTFYPSGGINVLFANRLNQRWMANVGIGLTAYFLTNQGPIDKYILDFASPQLSTGMTYILGDKPNKENTLKISYGVQLGFKGSFVEEFESYTVTVVGKDRWYHFLRADVGFRRYFKKKKKGARYKTVYDYGIYFRYNLNLLGKVTFEEIDFIATSQPRGNLLGVYLKLLIPAGRKRIDVKDVEPEIPPVIYNPRF